MNSPWSRADSWDVSEAYHLSPRQSSSPNVLLMIRSFLDLFTELDRVGVIVAKVPRNVA